MTAPKIKLYPASKIDARIALLHKNGQKLQTEMHKLACSVLKVLGETKDVRQTMKFIQAMPDMARTNGLRAWFETFGPIKFITEGEGEAAVERTVFVKDKATMLGDAMAKPFWKFSAKEGAPYEALNWIEYLNGQIKKLAKDIDKAPADEGTEDPRKALLAAMRGMLAPTVSQTVQPGDEKSDPLAA